jgi:hypothetical protein
MEFILAQDGVRSESMLLWSQILSQNQNQNQILSQNQNQIQIQCQILSQSQSNKSFKTRVVSKRLKQKNIYFLDNDDESDSMLNQPGMKTEMSYYPGPDKEKPGNSEPQDLNGSSSWSIQGLGESYEEGMDNDTAERVK